MHRYSLAALFAAVSMAQSAPQSAVPMPTQTVTQPTDPFAPKAPAAVDEALRARIQEFFDLHIKKQYRKAEELVAEDTKDYFYTHDKPTYISCEISKIDYTDHFTKASSVVTCLRYIRIPGFT